MVNNPKEKSREKSKKYFNSRPWVKSYYNARRRCSDKKTHNYHRYGGRGIKFLMNKEDVKMLWFRDKATKMSKPSLDRINNDEDYTSDNCRFIEFSDNLRNMNKARVVISKLQIACLLAHWEEWTNSPEYADYKRLKSLQGEP